MFEYIRGKLTEATPNKVTIEINGIGYGLLIPLSNYSKLPQPGHEVLMYISAVIREDSQKHYGFLNRSERDLFEKFNDVSGIGPKTSLALVGHMDLADLHLAISQANIHLICKVPGIGKKTAERLIIEMRDKLKGFDQTLPTFLALTSEVAATVVSDAISALVNLGYPANQAQNAIKKALGKMDSEQPKLGDLITSALQQM